MVASGGVTSPGAGGGRSMEKHATKVTTPTGGGKKIVSSSNSRGDHNISPSAAAAAAAAAAPSHHRRPDTDDPLLLSIAAKQSALVQQLITLTCYIPSSTVGAVIGRRGSTIAQIQQQAQQVGTSNGPVRLSIVGHQNEITSGLTSGTPAATSADSQPQPPLSPNLSLEEQSPTQQQQQQQQQPMTPLQATASVPYTYSELDWSSPLWTPVVIRADPCAALTAAQLLRDKVGQLDDVVMDVPLGRAKHSAIVGRRGYVLANLSADTTVRIMVPRRELRHDVIQLEGKLDNVKQCLERVLAISNETTPGPTGNSARKRGKDAIPAGTGTGTGTGANAHTGNSTNNNNNNSNNESRQQEKKDDAFSTVMVTVTVLPSQTKLRTVGRKTDTIIKKKKLDDSSWSLIVSGSSPDNVKSAVAILQKWNEDNSNKPSEGEQGTSLNSSKNNISSNSTPKPRTRRPTGRGNKPKGNNNRIKSGKTNANNNNSNDSPK